MEGVGGEHGWSLRRGVGGVWFGNRRVGVCVHWSFW